MIECVLVETDRWLEMMESTTGGRVPSLKYKCFESKISILVNIKVLMLPGFEVY